MIKASIRWVVLLCVGFLTLGCFGPPEAWGAERPSDSQQIGAVKRIQGTAAVKRAGAASSTPIREREPVYLEDILETQGDSKAWWRWSAPGADARPAGSSRDISDASLGMDSSLQFLFSERDPASTSFSASVDIGIVRFIKKLDKTSPPSSFNIVSPTASIEVIPTRGAADFTVEILEGPALGTVVTVIWGEVRVRNVSDKLSQERTLRSCQTVTVEKDKEPSPVRGVSEATLRELIRRTTIPNTLPEDVPACGPVPPSEEPLVAPPTPPGVILPPPPACPCPGGQYFDPRTNICRPCPPGTFYNPATCWCTRVRPRPCPCPAGQYRDPATNTCRPCPAGTFYNPATCWCDRVPQPPPPACPCPAGQFLDPAINACAPCPAGTFYNPATCLCDPEQPPPPPPPACPCPAEQYLDPVTNACTPCPAGTFYNPATCLCDPEQPPACPCPAGQFLDPAANACTPCPAGTVYNPATCLCDPGPPPEPAPGCPCPEMMTMGPDGACISCPEIYLPETCECECFCHEGGAWDMNDGQCKACNIAAGRHLRPSDLRLQLPVPAGPIRTPESAGGMSRFMRARVRTGSNRSGPRFDAQPVRKMHRKSRAAFLSRADEGGTSASPSTALAGHSASTRSLDWPHN